MRVVIVSVIILVVAAIGLPYVIFSGNKVLSLTEVRYYISVFMFLMVISCFSLLRIFNAIYQNTRVMLSLQREIITLKQVMGKLTLSVERWIKQLDAFSTVIKKKDFSNGNPKKS